MVETAADREGRYWAYATLNDSWTLRRRCRQEDAVFGLEVNEPLLHESVREEYLQDLQDAVTSVREASETAASAGQPTYN